jgi:hypothetical protein
MAAAMAIHIDAEWNGELEWLAETVQQRLYIDT